MKEQITENDKSLCPYCKADDIKVSPMQSHTANIGWVVVTSEAICNCCKKNFTYKSGYDNSKQFEWRNPNDPA